MTQHIECDVAECDNPAKKRGKCFKHGGGRTKRPQSGGRYAERLSARVFDFYERSMDDARQLDGRDVIALFDARLMQLLEASQEHGDGPEFREHARMLHRMATGKLTEDAPAAWEELGEWIDEGCVETSNWREILDVARKRQERAEAQVNLMLKGNNSISYHDFTILLGTWMKTIMDECGTEHRDLAKRILRKVGQEGVRGSDHPSQLSAGD